MLKIGEFAILARISIRMLRHYDEMGLLKPAHVDPESNYRYYELEQLPRLNRILALKDLGLSLDEIRQMLTESLSADEIRGMLKLKQAQLHQQIVEEQARLRRVENRLHDIEHEGKLPESEVVIKPQPSLHVMSLQGCVSPGCSIPNLFQVAYEGLVQHHLAEYIRGIMTIYHGSIEFQRTGSRSGYDRLVEVVYMVDERVQESISLSDNRQLVVRDTLAFNQVASLISDKPDHSRHLDAQALWRWIDQNQYRLVAPTREIYLRRPETSGGYLTEMLFPLEVTDEERL